MRFSILAAVLAGTLAQIAFAEEAPPDSTAQAPRRPTATAPT